MQQVYVIHKNGKPLMPCHSARARILLKRKQAKVVRMIPFTIQLTKDSEENIQEVTLGIDPGEFVGISVVSKKKVLYEEVLKMRTDVTQLITHRREMRRNRRFRKTRYRKARFNNRKTQTEGWISPTLRQKIETYKSTIDRLCKILPISKCVFEYTSFDIQKLENPDIQSEQYQHGQMEGFENVKAFVRYRDNYACQYCGKKNVKLHVHHIQFRSDGGSNRPDNLITLCEQCHKDLHNGKIQLNIKKLKLYKAATHLNILKDRLYKLLCDKFGTKNVRKTYGYITKYIRLQHNLPKEHYVDARVIAGGWNLKNDKIYQSIKLRRHNRKLHDELYRKDGTKRKIRLPYKVFNYQAGDIVFYNDKDYKNMICYISSRNSVGQFTFKNFNDIQIKRSYKHAKLIQHNNGYVIL